MTETARMTDHVYKILPARLWERARAEGVFAGAGIDIADGFIHLSDGGQAGETARLHFSGQPDLVLLTIDAQRLGPALVWEPSRGGALFPHLYGPLPLDAVVRWDLLTLDPAGVPVLPEPVGAGGPHRLGART